MRIQLLSILLLLTNHLYCQKIISPEYIDSLLKSHAHVKGKYISNYKVVPRETFRFDKRDKELFYFRILYPWDKVLEFFILNNQLVKIRLNKMDKERKKVYWNFYYFNNDTLIYKNENYITPQDINELKSLFNEYKTKSEIVKETNFK